MSENNTELMNDILEQCESLSDNMRKIDILTSDARRNADSHLKEYEDTIEALRSGGVKRLREIIGDLEKTVALK